MSWKSAIRTRHGLGWLTMIMLSVALVQGAGESPIVAAAKDGDRAAVRRLITARANVNEPGTDGSTALLWAAYNADVEMVRTLLTAGAKVDQANNYGITPLLQAARTGDTPVMEALLNGGANPKQTHPDGESPLMAAARTGRVDAIRLLLARGVDVNYTDSSQQETAIMWAAAEGHNDAVSALLEAGAKPNFKAKLTEITTRSHGDHPTGGFTALMWAVRNGHEEVVRTLVKGGAELNATNGDNLTAMNIAIINDRLDMAKTLLDLGADANDNALYFAIDMHDGTTDMRARDGGLLRWDHPNKITTLELAKLLLDKGADPNKAFVGAYHSTSMGTGENHNGTPFFRAAVASDVEALKLLVSRGANLEYTPVAAAGGRGGGNVGRTAIMVAATGGRGYAFGGGPGFGRVGPAIWREPGSRKPIEAVQILIDAGADLNAQNVDDGNSVVHQAAQRNDLNMLKAFAATKKVDFELYNWTGQRPIDIAEEAAATADRGAGRAGGAPAAVMPEGDAPQRATPKETVALLRELMGWPPLPETPAGQAASN